MMIDSRVLTYPWPSIQRDSEILAARCAAGLREQFLRERLEGYFEGKRAA